MIAASTDLTQTIDIETPELVVVSYTIAGIGSRVYAGLIDLVICVIAMFATVVALFAMTSGSRAMSAASARTSGTWVFAILILFQFAILWGYYLLFEGLRDGQTPGKRLLGLRVVRDGGYSVGFSASSVRNLMRIVDLQPLFTYAIGITSIAFTKSGKRLGDVVAGTIVVRETMVRQPAAAAVSARTTERASIPASAIAQLDDAEFQLLERWADRRSSLEPERRRQLASQVAKRLARALPDSDTGSESAKLIRLLSDERTARERGGAARGATGAARERYSIVAAGSPRWLAFAAVLAKAQRRGLSSLGEGGVRSFVEEYRALAADLARLRTAARGAGSDEVFYLSRLVAGAHNLIYRDRRSTWRQILQFVGIDVPTEVRRSVAPIGIAAVFLFGPAVIAYTAVVRQPAVAPTFIPARMLDRAQEGVTRAKLGTGYIQDPEMFRPVMASSIIANNVQVTIAVFALGITAGLGTLLMLLLNGVSLGGVFGLYMSKGILPLIVAFVAPHGVLELSAVCIAGGAGLLIAAALVLPGPRTRARALAENSRRAMRLITCSTVFLLAAGSLEGMVSPIPYWPLSLKLIVSAVTLVLVIFYLRGGAGSQQSAGFDLEIPVDDGGSHRIGRDIEHGDPGTAHSDERLLALSNQLFGGGASK
ncbi:MAG TPA: stage II sporulation protein M [Gemmatimonadaceae bacterium]|jgi:uncharacterized membrane protein SpoIIM required for sporulation/uncharacterized RDD family membrane protein YckC|nr:stage II sporulation protein M [Gemmatimonadaceae bacterium]